MDNPVLQLVNQQLQNSNMVELAYIVNCQLKYDIFIPNVSTECISCHFIWEDMIVVVI